MRHDKRRTKIGEMIIDVAKYLLTIGFIGNVFTEKINIMSGIAIIIVVTILALIGFYTIPPERKE
jgi:uncharacterized membrane protein